MKAGAIAPSRRNLLCVTKERCLYSINPLLPSHEDYEQSTLPHTSSPALCKNKKRRAETWPCEIWAPGGVQPYFTAPVSNFASCLKD